jgi:hypothetical protein
MTSARILFPDFREEQSDSRYPFIDTATLTATDGTTVIPKNTFYDASLFIINGSSNVYLSSILIETDLVTLNISDADNVDIARASFSPKPIAAADTGALEIKDTYDRPAGTIIVDAERLTVFAGWSEGLYEFEPAATEFAATTVIPANEPGVRGLLKPDGSLFTGDVLLVGDGGVVLRHVGEERGANIVRVDIIGVPLYNRFVCLPFERFTPKTFLRTINNCPPDEYGNFSFTATDFEVKDTVIRITQENGTVYFDAIGKKVV